VSDKEKYKLVSDICLARGNGKHIQVLTNLEGWQITNSSISVIANNILCGCSEYRIKPEPKTVTVRLAWLRTSNGCAHIRVISLCDADTVNVVEMWPDFIKWADEAKTYEEPE
jgi:hypothetical protein